MIIQIVDKNDLGNTLKIDDNLKVQVNSGDGIDISPDGVLSVTGFATKDELTQAFTDLGDNAGGDYVTAYLQASQQTGE